MPRCNLTGQSLSEKYPTAVVYGMCDPRTNALRYIGCTTQPLKVRMTNHYAERLHNFGGIPEKREWLRDLAAAGLKPDIFEIETAPYFEAQESEKFWIEYFRVIGAPLLNIRDNRAKPWPSTGPWTEARRQWQMLLYAKRRENQAAQN